jgi:hypothetical protein
MHSRKVGLVTSLSRTQRSPAGNAVQTRDTGARAVIAPANTASNLVVNGGFEAGQAPWQESSSGGYQMIDYSNPHSGSYSAWLCGYTACNDRLSQTVGLPAISAQLSLQFYTFCPHARAQRVRLRRSLLGLREGVVRRVGYLPSDPLQHGRVGVLVSALL